MLLITLLPGMPSNSSDLSMGEAALRAKNYSKAFEIYEPLAKEGIAETQFALGLLLSEGLGGPLNTKKATQLWMLAAEQGHASAQFNLGVLYSEAPPGTGVTQDQEKAASLWQRAAEQGHIRAQNNLGNAYHHGLGVPRDQKKAAFWFRKAAEQGEASSQVMYGYLLYERQGQQDIQEAVLWWKLAAEQNHSEGTYLLAALHLKGVGVPQSFVYAYMWGHLSWSKGGNVKGLEILRFAEKQMTSSDIERAQKLARECVVKNYKGCSPK